MIKFYGNVLVSVFNFFKYWKGEGRGYAISLFYIGASHFFIAASIFTVLNKSLRIDWNNANDKAKTFIGFAAAIAWLVVLAKQYTFERLKEMEKEFEDKPDRQQTLWGFYAILALVVPAVLFCIIITSPQFYGASAF